MQPAEWAADFKTQQVALPVNKSERKQKQIQMRSKIIAMTTLAAGIALPGSAQLTPLNIGIVAPNDSVVVYFDVTINSGLPAGTTYIATQATISGANFTSLLSDDPDTGIPFDSTKTFLTFSTLPVNFITFGATRASNSINLTWKVASQYNVAHYVVERSINGLQFDEIGQVPAFSSSPAITYNFPDHYPPSGILYYRIRSVDIDGRKQYSGVVRILPSGNSGSIQLLPTVTRDRSVNLVLNNLPRAVYNVEVHNSHGQNILFKKIEYSSGIQSATVPLPGNLPAGVYLLRVQNEFVSYTERLILQ
jgi:hypothetical protein